MSERQALLKYIQAQKEIIFADVSARIVELLNSFSKLVIACESGRGIADMLADFKGHAEPLIVYLRLISKDEAELLRKELDELRPETHQLLARARRITDKIVELANAIIKLIKEREEGVGI